MNCFIAILPPDSSYELNNVAESFPMHHEVLSDRVWAVAGHQTTCAEVCKELGIGEKGVPGVVIKMDEYYGFFDRALWDHINNWRALE